MKRKQGFSLLELILVLGIASAVSFMKFQDLKHEQEDIQAKAVGEQIKQVGEAVNGYISIRYDKLSTLAASTGTGTDPGPRTCSGSVCTITYQTLVNEGLLPSNFNGVNANRSSYTIQLQRSGTSPNYIINGLITTNSAWNEGNKIRYDLLGKAMQAAGVDSGMSKTTSVLSGYSGAWAANSSDFTGVNKVGQLGYRVGYDSSMYSVYLRRDGTLPMTGDLNMGSNSINNAQDITAAGTTTSGTLKSTGDTNVGGNLTVSQTGSFTGNIGVKGMSPNNQPAGYSGGVISPDYYGTGGIYIAKTSTNIPDKNWAFEANREGNLSISGNMNAGGNITSGNWITAYNGYGDAISIGGDSFPGGVGPDYEIKMLSNKPLVVHSPNSNRGNDIILDINGNTRIQTKIGTNGYNPNDIPYGWGGGLRTFDVVSSGTIASLKNGSKGTDGNLAAYMNQSGQIYASGNINVDGNAYINGSINSGREINVGGRLNAYEYVYVNGVAVSGSSCSPNGLLGRAGNGVSLSCVNGIWKASTPNVQVAYGTATAWRWPHAYANCPSGTQLVGGGGNCQSIPAAHGYMTLVGSIPNGNGWHAYCDTGENQNAIANAWAYCI